MHLRIARLVLLALLALPLLSSSAAHATSPTAKIVASSTLTAPNGDKVTTFYFSDGTYMVVIIKAGAQQMLEGQK